jgi:energy-coupling factor transporter ATP-binding protein EcfA2
MRSKDHPVPPRPLTIVEGPDGSGKTTLINSLGGIMIDDYDVMHHGAYLDSPSVMNKYMLPMLAIKRAAVFDRSWLSEPIYATIMRGGANRVPPWCRRMLERIALTRAGVVILCLRPFDEIRTSWAARRGEEYVRDEVRLQAVHEAYVALEHPIGGPTKLMATQLPTIVVDPTRTEPGEILARAEAVRGPLNRGPGIGVWKPGGVLLVGDRVSQRGKDGLPFISGLTTGCSAWLASQLDKARLGEDRLYWVNGYSKIGDELHGGFVDQLQPAAVIALGKEANNWVHHNVVRTIPRIHVPHPQYWKRFHNNKPYPLIKVVADLRHDGLLGD